MNQIELSTEIRLKVAEFNSLLHVANEMKLRVTIVQSFYPLANYNAQSLNPPLSVSITETVLY